jgi:hypothetical protein
MTVPTNVLRELTGLFVDDGRLRLPSWPSSSSPG